MVAGRRRNGACSLWPRVLRRKWHDWNLVWDKTARFLTGRSGAILKRRREMTRGFVLTNEGLVSIYGSLHRFGLQVVPS
jgi:hypothetical protein